MSRSKLDEAICQAVLACGEVKRDTPTKDGGHISSCDAYYRVAREPMAKNGLTLHAKAANYNPETRMVSRTFRVEHASSDEGRDLPVPPVGYDPFDRMARGAALKSQRRVVISELLMLVQEPESAPRPIPDAMPDGSEYHGSEMHMGPLPGMVATVTVGPVKHARKEDLANQGELGSLVDSLEQDWKQEEIESKGRIKFQKKDSTPPQGGDPEALAEAPGDLSPSNSPGAGEDPMACKFRYENGDRCARGAHIGRHRRAGT